MAGPSASESDPAEAGTTPVIGVIGSINMDVIVRAPHFPAPGETVLGGPLSTGPGGKGANQAIAAARLGAQVLMLGRVGSDAYGAQLQDVLAREQVALSPLARGPVPSSGATDDDDETATEGDVATGVAIITVNEAGENTIVVAPGANARVRPEDVESFLSAHGGHLHALIMQLEVPIESVHRAIERATAMAGEAALGPADAASNGASTPRPLIVLNAAPAPPADRPLPASLLRGLDLLIVNATEARQVLAGLVADDSDSDSHSDSESNLDAEMGAGAAGATRGSGERHAFTCREAAESALASNDPADLALALLAAGPREVALTLGAEGAIVAHESGDRTLGDIETAYQPAFRVEVVDTTAAGDAFVAAYVVQRSRRLAPTIALRYACAAGAAAATRLGAVPSLPTPEEVERMGDLRACAEGLAREIRPLR